ncbi:MAG: hypothetical protein AAGD34_04220 [Pseudomonadota bacterium]
MADFIGGEFIDYLEGTSGRDVIFGDPFTTGSSAIPDGMGGVLEFGAGSLRFGIGGSDVLRGLAGGDTIVGDAAEIGPSGRGGFDIIKGGDGKDALIGDAEVQLFGVGGGDIISGGKGADFIFGDAVGAINGGGVGGDDVLRGGKAADIIVGDAGGILQDGEGGDDRIYGGNGNDSIWGDAFSFFADPSDDEAIAHAAATESAIAGDDFISGGRGNDEIYGDGAVDGSLLIETGADTFYFGERSGLDIIFDYEPGKDILWLGGYGNIDSFDDLIITDNGTDTTIDLGASNGDAADRNMVTLIAVTEVSAADFQFA